MASRFAELDYRETPMGPISLRRRVDPATDTEIHEVKLGDEFLMSSRFTVAETEMAKLGLAALCGDRWDVLVGGLGLGYTARAALEDDRVRSLVVVETIDAVIDWHRRHLVPVAEAITGDPRHHFVHGDFFALAADPNGFDPDSPGRRFHAILLDIDHAPDHLLNPSHADFYTVEGLRRMGRHLHADGVFALWSNNPPDEDFNARLARVFATVEAHVVTFDTSSAVAEGDRIGSLAVSNPLRNRTSTNTVYVTHGPRD